MYAYIWKLFLFSIVGSDKCEEKQWKVASNPKKKAVSFQIVIEGLGKVMKRIYCFPHLNRN